MHVYLCLVLAVCVVSVVHVLCVCSVYVMYVCLIYALFVWCGFSTLLFPKAEYMRFPYIPPIGFQTLLVKQDVR